MANTIRLLTRGHYAYGLGYFDGRSGKPADMHYNDKCLCELYALGFDSGRADRAVFDKEAV